MPKKVETLEWKSGHTEMSVEQLSKTTKYQFAMGGLPALRPVEHDAFLNQLTEIASPAGEVNWEPIVCTEKNALMLKSDSPDKKTHPVEDYLIQQFVTKAIIHNNQSNGTSTALGVSFSSKGITVAFGQNVQVCSNMCVWGANVVRTSQQLKYDNMMDIIREWVSNHEAKAAEDRQKINLMKNTHINDGTVDLIWGEIIRNAVLGNEGITTPILNVAQTGRMIRTYQDQVLDTGEEQTMWNLMNAATEEMLPTNTDQTKIWQMHNRVSDYFLERAEALN